MKEKVLKKFITHGVSQGMVSGPILCILYINEILNFNSTGIVIIFAYYTNILYTERNWENLKKKAETDMSMITNCFSSKLYFGKLVLFHLFVTKIHWYLLNK